MLFYSLKSFVPFCEDNKIYHKIQLFRSCLIKFGNNCTIFAVTAKPNAYVIDTDSHKRLRLPHPGRGAPQTRRILGTAIRNHHRGGRNCRREPATEHNGRLADALPQDNKKTNIGRAAIRNLLARESRYPNLIFIDCDAVVEKDDFLRLYADALKDYDVVCGALYHANEQPNDECSLRYRYEKEADRQRDAITRDKAPYDKFTTFNFAIKKDIFTSILFNESITRYGYEDALFGKELKRRGIPIRHIDNKLLHSGLESNAVFLAKSEQALATLHSIEDRMGSTPLLAALRKLRALHLESIFMIYWNLHKESLRKNLLGRKPSLTKFKIYKLGYYISLQKKKEISTP